MRLFFAVAAALALILPVAVAPAAPATVRAGASFPCQWKWGLQYGHRPGYVVAVASADCAGLQGSLTISVRLFKWNPKSRTWHPDRAQTKTWKDLRDNRYLGVAEPCTSATFRAEFGWVLRDGGGSVVSRNAVKSASLKVPGPDCRIGIA